LDTYELTFYSTAGLEQYDQPALAAGADRDGGSLSVNASRRIFFKSSAAVTTGLILTQAAGPARLLATLLDPGLAPYDSGQRMAATPATDYRAYRSKPVSNQQIATWVQIDLGESRAIESVLLYPASERMYPGRDQYYAGEGFPLRFRIEVSEEAEFARCQTVADLTASDFPDVGDMITKFSAPGIKGRYVRLTATRLRPVKTRPKNSTPTGETPEEGSEFTLTLAKIGILSAGRDVAVGCHATGDAHFGNMDGLGQLTRAARQDGEQIEWDHPQQVTNSGLWKPAKGAVRIPKTGVTLGDGLFRPAMEKNIDYLLTSFSTDELLRQFYERAGKIPKYEATGPARFWEEDLAGSNAGRFLMGAANTVRWIEHPELQRRIATIVDGIAACKEPNGYIMAYPADSIFYSERAAYTRAWLTHGLLEAGYSGNTKALELLRGYYDWFNGQAEILPSLLRGAVQGGQGMIANTRVGLSPAGKPADIEVIQRYFEEPAFLRGIAAKEERQIWQYPYDRPHCYLLTNLEAYLDLYLATGELRYHDAVLGAWELYRNNWEQPGGSISIIEFRRDPPGSYYLHEELGELCGSSFWAFLSQRFHILHPDEERYVSEIEKSIYNVAMANQDGSYGLRYHTHLEGTKEKATRINSCCEGQGTRLLGSLPEHIYSLADDGIYLNLFEPSAIAWKQNGQSLELTQKTRFPLGSRVECSLLAQSPTKAKMRIRVPSWAHEEMQIEVNGKEAGSGKPGSYVAIERLWSNGDSIAFNLPIKFRASRYNGADQIAGATRYSLEYGPFLYAAVGSPKVELDSVRNADELIAALEPMKDRPLHYRLRGNELLTFMPYLHVNQEEFTCFPAIRNDGA
jgi:hypothetical protein